MAALEPGEIFEHLVARVSPHELLELVAGASESLRTGERKLTAIFSNGHVRRSYVELGPLREEELDALF
jgi:hypothetical protein